MRWSWGCRKKGNKRGFPRSAAVLGRLGGLGIGPLTRALATARFCRMLGTMLANSVPVLQAMQISREAAGNGVLEEAI